MEKYNNDKNIFTELIKSIIVSEKLIILLLKYLVLEEKLIYNIEYNKIVEL